MKALKRYMVTENGVLCVFNNVFTGKEVIREFEHLTVSEIEAWINGELIQNAMPLLSAEERELFLTGCTDW